jgi:hypothetical protein
LALACIRLAHWVAAWLGLLPWAHEIEGALPAAQVVGHPVTGTGEGRVRVANAPNVTLLDKVVGRSNGKTASGACTPLALFAAVSVARRPCRASTVARLLGVGASQGTQILVDGGAVGLAYTSASATASVERRPTRSVRARAGV